MKIAIIGAGIGGSSLAHYLSDDKFKITVFEKRSLTGGRIRNIEIDGKIVETGAGFFHSVNQNINTLVKELNIDYQQLSSDTFGLINENKMLYHTGDSNFINAMKLLFRFGFKLKNLQKGVKIVKDNITNFYQEDQIFNSIPEMIEYMNFTSIYSKTLEENLISLGVSEKIIAELAVPMNRYIYHQCGTRNMNGFAGFVSLIASDGKPIYYIKDSNKTLCDKLLERTNADIKLNTQVKSIKKVDGKYEIISSEGSNTFDIVILACPQEIAKINFEKFEMNKISADRKYFSYTKTIIAGDIKADFFGLKSLPDMIITTENGRTPMVGMSKLGISPNGNNIWTISSENKLDRSYLDKLFDIKEIQEEDVLYTYPILDPIALENFEPMILDKNLFYINGVDSLSPTMESSIIVARNISRLIKNNQ